MARDLLSTSDRGVRTIASYVENSIADGETYLYRARFPAIYHVISWLWLIVLGVIIVGIVVFLWRQIRAWTTEIAVTSQRIVLKTGWLRVSTEELALRTIEEINVSQSFWGRLFDYGRVRASGTGDGLVAFPPVQAPVELRSAISNARASARR